MALSQPTTDEEVDAWAEFTATRGFGSRPGPVGRFLDKLLSDPTFAPALLVTLRESQRYVAGLRIFDRACVLPDQAAIRVLGLGEVCTEPDMRGKGLAGTLLAAAVDRMRQTVGAGDSTASAHAATSATTPAPAVSLLHAAANVQGLYAKFGYQPLHMAYGSILLQQGSSSGSTGPGAGVEGSATAAAHPVPDPQNGGAGTNTSSGLLITRADFDSDWPALSRLYESTCRRLGAVGWFARDEAYWKVWMPAVSSGWAGSESVAAVRDEEKRAAAHATGHRHYVARCPSCGAAVAYAAVQWRWERYRLADWGCMPLPALHSNARHSAEAGGQAQGQDAGAGAEGEVPTAGSCSHPCWTGSAALSFLTDVTLRTAALDGRQLTLAHPSTAAAATAVAEGAAAAASSVDAAPAAGHGLGRLCVPGPVLMELHGAAAGGSSGGAGASSIALPAASGSSATAAGASSIALPAASGSSATAAPAAAGQPSYPTLPAIILEDPSAHDDGWMARAIGPEGRAGPGPGAGADGVMTDPVPILKAGPLLIYTLDAF